MGFVVGSRSGFARGFLRLRSRLKDPHLGDSTEDPSDPPILKDPFGNPENETKGLGWGLEGGERGHLKG